MNHSNATVFDRTITIPMNNLSRASFGFTLVELLVVIAIIGVLMGLLIPSVQAVRENARRVQCQANLNDLSLALMSYHTLHNHYPIGTLNPEGPIRSEPMGYHHNWIEAILPHMDESVIGENINTNVSVYAAENLDVRRIQVSGLMCPSATGVQSFTSCYAGIHSSTETAIDTTNDGVFILNVPTSQDDISDGLGYTLFLGEKLSYPADDLSWLSGTRSTLRNVGGGLSAAPVNLQQSLSELTLPDGLDPMLYVGSLQSHHPSGVHLLMGSGEVSFRSTSMDAQLLAELANKSDGGLPRQSMSDIDPVEAFRTNREAND